MSVLKYCSLLKKITVLFRPSLCMKRKQAAITLIIATLEQLSSLGEENHETLRSNCAMSSSRLLKKPDQCRSVATCAHVFWSGHFTNEDREVMEVSQTLCVFIYDVFLVHCVRFGLLRTLHR